MMKMDLVTGRVNEVGTADVYVIHGIDGRLRVAIREAGESDMTRKSIVDGETVIMGGQTWRVQYVPVKTVETETDFDGVPLVVAHLTPVDV